MTDLPVSLTDAVAEADAARVRPDQLAAALLELLDCDGVMVITLVNGVSNVGCAIGSGDKIIDDLSEDYLDTIAGYIAQLTPRVER